MIRFIQFIGAVAGTAFGLMVGLALLDQAHELVEPANRPAFLTAFVVAGFLFGYLLTPYVTIYPTPSANSPAPAPPSRSIARRLG